MKRPDPLVERLRKALAAPDTLAERFRDPKRDAVFKQTTAGIVADNHVIRDVMLRAKRYVMADSATRLAVQLSNRMPFDIERMLDSIDMPAPMVWVEMSSGVMLGERARLGTIPSNFPAISRPPDVRTGMLVKDEGDGTIQTWCIEDGYKDEYDDITGKVVAWPVSYRIGLTKPQQAWMRNDTSLMWGYADDSAPGLIALSGRAVATMAPSYMRHVKTDGANRMMHELQGWTRLTAAILAMFSSVASIETCERPAGMIRLGGAMRPRLHTDKLVLIVPKRIRKPLPWAMKAIRAQASAKRRRLHEVSRHARHLDHRPAAPGWEEVRIGSRTMWRKWIEAHLRGDPDLGVVEHRETHVIARPVDLSRLTIVPPEGSA